MFRFGFIGFGKMAKAIWKGLISEGFASPNEAAFYTPNASSQFAVQAEFNLRFLPISQLARECSVLFFCVKPQRIHEVLELLLPPLEHKPLCISILAGTPLQTFKEALPDCPIVRVMPNTPATLKKGMTALCYTKDTPSQQVHYAKQIFEQCGKVVEVSESQMDTVTGLSGSGPAFLYQFANMMIAEAEKSGMDPVSSLLLAGQTLVGAGEMLLQSHKSPADLIADVCSPNGTTEAGLNEWKHLDIDAKLASVFKTTILRSEALGKPLS
jgi:pyrroline-5-carboxylate reductase